MNAPMEIRLPPHSTEAEQSLIGGLILDSRAWDRIVDLVTDADFFRDDHRRIFRHCALLANTGKPWDIAILFESIQRANEVEQTGGLAYLGEIANNTPSVAAIRRHAEIVREKARLRKLITLLDETAAACFNPGSLKAVEIIEEAERRLAIETDQSIEEPAALQEVLNQTLTTTTPEGEIGFRPLVEQDRPSVASAGSDMAEIQPQVSGNRMAEAAEPETLNGTWNPGANYAPFVDQARTPTMGNMVGNAAMLIDKAVKNEARRKVANLSAFQGGGRFMVKIDTESRPVKISGDQVLDAMLKRYGIAIDGDAPAFFEFLIKGQPPAGGNVVALLRHGQTVWFEVGDPVLYRSLQAIDRPMQSEVVKWLGLPKRIGQATITATPDFWMANIARDTLMGSVMSRAGFRPILDSLEGMRLRMTKDPLYRDYIANGGGLSSIFLDEHHLRTKLERFYRDQGIDYRTVLDTPDKLLTFIETLGDSFEMSTRLGEYKRAIGAGENPRHAAYLGRDVSTDFAMRGDSKTLGFLYDTVMFLKPAVVSWDRLYRGLAHDPNKGAIAVKAGTMALMSVGLYLLNRDRPEFQDMESWKRDAYWHFYVPMPDGSTKHFMLPRIWEIGSIASLAERSTERLLDENPEELGKDFARILGATFNVNLMPQIIAPLAEQMANRNSFTGAPIETPGMQEVQPFLRAKPGTSETMKAAGMATRDLPESLQVNPARAEALLRGYFNTYALYGLMLTDQALFKDALPEKRADELPVVRRFYSQEPARHTKYEDAFYDLLEESQRLRGTMRTLDKMGRSDIADEKEQSPLSGEAKPLERAQKNLAGINKDMEAVRRDKTLTSAQKREKLDALTVERNALLKAAVQGSEAAQSLKE